MYHSELKIRYCLWKQTKALKSLAGDYSQTKTRLQWLYRELYISNRLHCPKPCSVPLQRRGQNPCYSWSRARQWLHRRHRGPESPWPHALGGANEYAESTGGGSCSNRVGLSIIFVSGGCHRILRFTLQCGYTFSLLILSLARNIMSIKVGVQYGIYDAERSKQYMGDFPSDDKLLLFCGTYSRRRKNGNRLADSQKCEKAIR